MSLFHQLKIIVHLDYRLNENFNLSIAAKALAPRSYIEVAMATS